MIIETENISDDDIQALVDGEICPSRERDIRTAVIKSPKLLKRYEELTRQKILLQRWWEHFHKEN